VSWTEPADLKEQLARLWDRGELLRDVLTGNARFPLRLTIKLPRSADITDRFDAVRTWAERLARVGTLRIEWQVVRHRVQGAQKLPASVWVDTVEDALNWLGKRREWDCFSALVTATLQTHPALLTWLEKRPLQALELSAEWPRLLDVVSWLAKHPHPGIYLRQVDLPGVHSKFIEMHRSVLAELFDLVLPVDAVNITQTGINQFASRFGFREKPTRIRFRVLDQAIQILPNSPCPDITLDAESFSRLQLPLKHVFITENEINFLAFPQVGDAIVIFGAGYGWDALARCDWLKHCAIHYWGDIDTHGFGILDQLRGYFDHVESFLMDSATLEQHVPFWGLEEKPLQADLHRLTPKERALYNDLRDNRIRPCLRLEQEHISFNFLNDFLKNILFSRIDASSVSDNSTDASPSAYPSN